MRLLRALGVVVLLSGVVGAQPRALKYSEEGIGPATATAVPITIAAPGARKRNCLTQVIPGAILTDRSIVVNLISGGTTNYAVVVSTGAYAQIDFPVNDPWCAGLNSTLQINVLSALGAAVPSPRINYRGFIREE